MLSHDTLRPFAGTSIERTEILAVSVATSMLSLALPMALIQVYDRILPNSGIGTAWLLFGGVFAALVLEAMLKCGRAYLMGAAAARFEAAAGRAMFDRIIDCDVGAFESVGRGEHLERFNALAQVRDFYAGSGVITWLDLLFSAIFLAVMYYLAGDLVLIPLTIALACIGMLLLSSVTLRRSIRTQHRADEEHTDFLLSVLGGLTTVKSLAMEQLLTRRYERLQESRMRAGREVETSTTAVTDMTAFFGQVSVVGIASYGAMKVIEGELTVGALAACTLLSGRAFQPLQSAIGYWARAQTVDVARTRIQRTLALPVADDASTQAPPVSANSVGAHLELRDVSLRYGEEGPNVFEHVNVSVEAGEMIAVTGPNGGGKSALLSIMAGLQSPTTGSVLFDDVPLTQWPRSAVQQAIAYVPQYEALFAGTMLDNITAFRPELTERAYEVAERLGFASAVRALPHGFGTVVGNGSGESIPGGLSQRIILARTLVDHPRLLIIDAAYTAMDYEGDQVIKSLLTELKGSCTIVLVTHRPSLMWLADRVHDLSDGVFEQSGLHVQSLKS